MLLDIDLKPSEAIAAIEDTGKSVTYGQLVECCQAFKQILTERELVFCLCENTIGALAGYLSLYDNKDVALLLNASIDRGLLNELIRIYQPAYFWLPEKYQQEFGLESIFQTHDYILAKTGYQWCPMEKQLALLLTTSGSTGSPKLVRYKYGNIEANARNVAKVFGWTAEERAICDLPMQYSMGLNVINTHLLTGGTLLLVSTNLVSPVFWKFIREYKATSFTGVPYSYEILFKLKFLRMDLPHLKTFAEGGGKLTDSAFQTLADFAQKEGKRFFATFGTTETSARMAYLSPELATVKCGSIGQALPGSEMFLIDENGNTLEGADVEGELSYKGPNVTLGYAVCREDLLKGDDFQGVYQTGDIARRDKDGCYYIIGRKKRFLKLFGLRISLDQCERLITDEFGIECACVGDDSRMEVFINDESMNTDVKSFISTKTGLPGTAFNINVIESIPRNESGKINYRILNLENGKN